ncbi:MAG: hypothetical protein JWM57_1293 [Phycisphaerales bacterium]|nr:hypothetical protein [Phycisphaerales bacterium]
MRLSVARAPPQPLNGVTLSSGEQLLPRRTRSWFTITAGLSLMLCVAAVTAQVMGWGTPLIASTHNGSYGQTDYVYGIVVMDHAWPYAYIFLATCWLPAAWLLVFVVSLTLRMQSGRGDSAAG